MIWRRWASGLLAPGLAIVAGACGSGSAGTPAGSAPAQGTATLPAALLAQMRPIGVGPRFHPGVSGSPTGGCRPAPGRLVAHIELFGANRVVLIPAGVGQRHRCFGNVVTADPTGVVHFRPGARLSDLFQAWGQPLSATRMASFRGRVRYYVAGRRVASVGALAEHAEIVVEVGPYVPPHHAFTFTSGGQARRPAS